MAKETKKKYVKSITRFLVAFFILVSYNLFSQTTIFSESMGSVGGTTSISAHETANGFDNDSYTMTQGGAANPADLRATSVSSGYAGASGAANVWFTTTNAQYGFAIEGIDASLYTNLTVDFAVRKEGASGTAFATFALDYWDGSSYQPVTLSGLPTAANNAGWYLITGITLPAAANINGLRLRFTKTGTIACRLDDVILKGTGACPEPTTQATSPIASSIEMNSMTISWTNGNGANRLVAVKPISNPAFAPVDGTSYAANSIYGQGSSLGYGWVVYNGTGSSVTVTGLVANTAYYFLIYEFNCTNYDTLSPTAINATTLGGIVINEIMVNPAGPNDGTNAPNTSEWIEFYNASATAIDISCWFFTDGDFAVTFPMGTIIPAGGFFVVASAAGSGLTPDLDWALCGCTSGPSSQVGIFTNGNEQVLLYNASGTLIDAVIWGGGQLPGSMTTTAGGGCASQSVTFPAAGASYDDIGTVSDGVANEAVYDGSSTWQQTGTATVGSTNGADPLPIELLSFNVKPKNNSVEINWATATEVNNDFFTIERSEDGIYFTAISTIDGSGNSTWLINYSNTDNNPINGISYYRLKQTDFDENFTFSAIKAVFFDKKQDENVIIYPNPTKDNLTIRLNNSFEEGSIEIIIYSAYSQVVLKQLINNFSQEATILTNTLSKGTYIICITSKSYSNKQLFIKN